MAEVIKTVNSNVLSGYGANKNYRTLLGGVKINLTTLKSWQYLLKL